MSELRYLQVDVFCERAGGGNPLGVVIGAATWTTAEMQDFAAFTNLVETTFLLPPTLAGASHRLRIFTPTREIAFAGHPTIGSVHAALESGLVRADQALMQECQAGLLPIVVEDNAGHREIFVQAPPARVLRERVSGDALLRDILDGVSLGALKPALVEGGRRWWVAELAREADVRGFEPDYGTLTDLARADDALGLCIFARADAGNDYDLVVRAFPLGVGIAEDPASGAANGLIGAYIALAEPDGPLSKGYRVSQGREIGHDASIRIRYRDGRTWVGGRSHTVVRGDLTWPTGGGAAD